MKYKFILIFFFLLPMSGFCQSSETKKVAILEVVDEEGKISNGIKLMLRSTLAEAVSHTPGYEAYDRNYIDEIIKELKIQQSGMVSDADKKRLGEMAGAAYVLVTEAAYMDPDQEYLFVSAAMMDVEKGKTVTVTAYNLVNELDKACNELVLKLFGDRGVSKISEKTEEEILAEARKKYDTVDDFHEKLAAVKKDHKWGYIDNTGKEVIPLIYDFAFDFSDGLAHVESLPESLRNTEGLNQLSALFNDGKHGCIDKNGNVIIPIIYDHLSEISEGLIAAVKNDKWGFIDKLGNIVIPFIYEGAGDFHEGLAAVANENYNSGGWGYIDKNGNLVIPFKYGYVSSFSEGLAKVANENGFGFIDKEDNVIIPFIYDWAESFSDDYKGLAKVTKNDKEFYIDRFGNYVKDAD